MNAADIDIQMRSWKRIRGFEGISGRGNSLTTEGDLDQAVGSLEDSETMDMLT